MGYTVRPCLKKRKERDFYENHHPSLIDFTTVLQVQETLW